MYISSNWILAKVLRTVLSMVRECGGRGKLDQANGGDSSPSRDHGSQQGLAEAEGRSCGLPSSEGGLSVM